MGRDTQPSPAHFVIGIADFHRSTSLILDDAKAFGKLADLMAGAQKSDQIDIAKFGRCANMKPVLVVD